MEVDWAGQAAEQLDWHWKSQLRPRLDGLTDDEYFWEPVDSFGYAGTARDALAQLDETYGRWMTGVRGLGAEGMARPCGPAEGPFADSPLGALVLHINREVIHHGAEIALLRDLYLHRER